MKLTVTPCSKKFRNRPTGTGGLLSNPGRWATVATAHTHLQIRLAFIPGCSLLLFGQDPVRIASHLHPHFELVVVRNLTCQNFIRMHPTGISGGAGPTSKQAFRHTDQISSRTPGLSNRRETTIFSSVLKWGSSLPRFTALFCCLLWRLADFQADHSQSSPLLWRLNWQSVSFYFLVFRI